MKKNYLFIGAAAIMMAGCASDDLVGDENISSGETPIAFSMNTPNVTRDAEANAADASKLNQEFIVWGEKAEEENKTTDAANLVFENYRVQYSDANGSTKNSTVSNTAGWDYVGIAPYASGVTPKITAATQTIKYWDLGKKYTFTAVSAKPRDISGGNVTIAKTIGATNLASKSKGYTITLKKDASASDIFVAKRKEVSTSTTETPTAVKMEFYNFQTKIRFGFYETVPGYKVQITGVKYDSKTSYVSDKFGVDGSFITVPTTDNETVVYSVTYDENNIPVINVTTTKTGNDAVTTTVGYKEFGSNVFNKDLGTTSNTSVVYDKSDADYTYILPNNNNQTPMSFTVSYKLISEDTQEEIAIADKKVTVPAAYCQWKPNFAYTYLFKVSDSSTGLYPITFDACVVASQTGNQETITEVGEPSITTYAWDSSNKKVITGKDEYETGNVIYAATNVADGMTSTNTVLYTVTATTDDQVQNAVAPKITEASVANCVANMTPSADSHVAKDATGGILTVTKFTTDTNNFVTNAVPTEDGNGTRTINALTWTDSNTNEGTYYYAVEYTYNNKKYYKIVKVVKQQ